MTLLEAIDSGLPFKIPEMIDYLYVSRTPTDVTDFLFWADSGIKSGQIPVYALFATNWEVMDIPNNVLAFPGKPIPPGKPDTAS